MEAKAGLTALVFGAGGLTGKLLTEKLLEHPSFSVVKTFSRKPSGSTHPKAEEVIADFNDPVSLEKNIEGDVLFCCLGTTIRAAGSREAFEKIDLHYPQLLSTLAARKQVKKFLVISSLGADKSSSNFYYRTKALCEEKVAASGVRQVYIFRPGLLLGKRKEFRFGELMAKFFMQALSFAFIGGLKKYRAVKADKVAEAMLWFALNGNDRLRIVENKEILDLIPAS